jgi:hypothetical protein
MSNTTASAPAMDYIPVWDVVTMDRGERIVHDTFATEDEAIAYCKTLHGSWVEYNEVEGWDGYERGHDDYER